MPDDRRLPPARGQRGITAAAAFLSTTAPAPTADSLSGSGPAVQGQSSPYVPSASPEPVAHLAQHLLLPMLHSRVAACPGVEVRMAHSATAVQQEGADVRVQVEGPGGKRYWIAAQYLVAADGAHSALRSAVGVPLEGPGPMQHLINIHFTSPEVCRGSGVRGFGGLRRALPKLCSESCSC